MCREVVDGLRFGRVVALTKRNGGIRAQVMDDAFRRLVSRTLAQQFADAGALTSELQPSAGMALVWMASARTPTSPAQPGSRGRGGDGSTHSLPVL